MSKKKVEPEFIDDEELDLVVPEDSSDMVSPDGAIFTKVAENLNKPKPEKSYTATWHGGQDEKIEDFKVDDAYASSVNADKQFMKAFGISETGTHKTVTSLDKPQNTSEFAKDDIYSNEYEYTDVNQKNEIIEMYQYAKRSSVRKIAFSMVFLAFVFFIENIAQFFNSVEYFDISKHPYVHIIASAVCLLGCIICAREQLFHGIRSIFKRDLAPESVAVFAMLAGVLHTVATVLFIAFGYNTKIMLLNFPACAALTYSVVFTHINIKRERYGFGVISVKRPKFVLEKVQETSAETEFDTFTTSNGEFIGEIGRARKTPFVKNYFVNTNTSVDTRKYLKIYYIFAFVFPLALAITSLFFDRTHMNPYIAGNYFFVGLFLTLPVGILFVYSVPFYLANASLYEDGVSIIGEESILDFASVTVSVVNDTAIFPPKNVKIKNIMGYNDYDIERITYLAASGFATVGGPLARVFDEMLNNSIPKSSRARFVCAGRSYLSVSIDGHSVIFADKFGMTSQGIEVGADRDKKNDLSVMYMACDGILCSKMYIKYDVNEEFYKTTKYVNSKGVKLGIRTFDPNINNDMINKLTGFNKKYVRVIKLSSASEAPVTTSWCDGQIVSKGSSCALLKAVPMCKRILKIRKVVKAIKILSAVLGLAYLALCIFAPINFGPLNVLPSGIIVLIHIVFAFFMYVVSCLLLPKRK